jgi:hypothetical protein
MRRFSLLGAVGLVLAACSTDTNQNDGPSEHEPAVAHVAEPQPFAEDATIDAASGSFRARLTLPAGDGTHPLVIVAPGLGPWTADTSFGYHRNGIESAAEVSFHSLGVGTLAIDLPGCASDDDGAQIVDPDAFGTATRSLVRERLHAALGWASGHPRVAPFGHYVITTDFGAADATTFADAIDAAAVIWMHPIVQSAYDYLYDELHYRDWLRRSVGADLDHDSAISPEEWGYYKGSAQIELDVTFAEIDVDGDGSYTRGDNALAGAARLATMMDLLASGDEVGWRAFWNERTVLFPSSVWAADAMQAPSAADALAAGSTPIYAYVMPSTVAPPEYTEALEAAPGASGRLHTLTVDDYGLMVGRLPTLYADVHTATSCLRGLVTTPLDPEQLAQQNQHAPPWCAW